VRAVAPLVHPIADCRHDIRYLSNVSDRRRLGIATKKLPPLGWRSFLSRERTMIVAILVVILILVLLGGGYGYRSGNNILAGGGGLVGLILVILLVLFLLEVIHL
jgi:hypothetical protein